MVNAWFSERVHPIPVCKEGAKQHGDACSCPSHQAARAESTNPTPPTRKISASEFDRPLRPIVVKDCVGTVSFLSDSEKKEQMPLQPRTLGSDAGDQCSRLLELVKDISSHLDVTALCHKIFLHIHELIAADRYSLFLVCEDSSNEKFLISRLFDVAEGSTLEEASNNGIRLEWNKGIVGHVAALGQPLNIKDAYEVNKEYRNCAVGAFYPERPLIYSQTSSYIHLCSCPFCPTSMANLEVTGGFAAVCACAITPRACPQQRLSW
uniref:GAF domain-containing protein n=1 Tax=Podarcis muralis TaxID=64176 RepID=A0A670JQH6_PODMU